MHIGLLTCSQLPACLAVDEESRGSTEGPLRGLITADDLAACGQPCCSMTLSMPCNTCALPEPQAWAR